MQPDGRIVPSDAIIVASGIRGFADLRAVGKEFNFRDASIWVVSRGLQNNLRGRDEKVIARDVGKRNNRELIANDWRHAEQVHLEPDVRAVGCSLMNFDGENIPAL